LAAHDDGCCMQDTQTNDDFERSALAQKLVELGPYRLREMIGQGGMGAVYLADQTEPVKRRVAIKVTRIDLTSIGRVARFESERQILATLKHPNIAQVLDAGSTPEGYPFMVMEYIDGVAVDLYAKREKLSIAARLELILQACDAVAHAHQNGIIHRDLKPENLIVEQLNQRPRVKLIDFGIAKLVQGAERHMTVTGTSLGTPRYMSPEQSKAYQDLDTRTDVYSLGLTMFRLLTGALPHESSSASPEGRDATEFGPESAGSRNDRFDDRPMSPSRAAKNSSDALLADVGISLSPAALSTSLRGELDWIVLKAIAPEREHRYGSIREFAQDIERFLAQEPVLAAPPSRWYPWGKFFARYRWQTTVMLMFAVLLGLTSLSLLSAWQEERAARQLADLQLKQHEFFNAFLIDVLGSVKPSQAGADITLSDVLNHAVAKLPEQHRRDPANALALRLLLSKSLAVQATRQAERASHVEPRNPK
jgi:eukaryotic-like serine/threonine-protein kinase